MYHPLFVPHFKDECLVSALDGDSKGRFYASCSQFSGVYYPILFEWTYHHTLSDARTVFYYGPLPEFYFSLPPGLESNGFKVYVSVEAIDGRGVRKTMSPKSVTIPPRHNTGDGVLSIFSEISKMVENIPSLELEEVRSLAWELNLIENTIFSQTVFDNILTIMFYRESCKESLETVGSDPNDVIADNSVVEMFYKVNMLKSCARDHLAELACASIIRNEMEILQVRTGMFLF